MIIVKNKKTNSPKKEDLGETEMKKADKKPVTADAPKKASTPTPAAAKSAAADKKEKKEGKTRFNMISFAKGLLAEGKSETDVSKAISKIYAEKGKTDEAFVTKRAQIYIALAKG